LNDARGKARINGFRPGKVPTAHLRKVYGKSFMAEVVNEILNNSSRDILAERGEKAAMQPEVVMTEDEKEAEQILAGKKDFEFVAELRSHSGYRDTGFHRHQGEAPGARPAGRRGSGPDGARRRIGPHL
jgi:hypothetical protein